MPFAVADPILIPEYVPASPAADAAELARLAPLSRGSTALVTYGDARLARQHHAGGQRRGLGFACVGLDLGAARCPPATRPRGGRSYVLTPAYASAPQTVGARPGSPSPLRSPFARIIFDTYGVVDHIVPPAP